MKLNRITQLIALALLAAEAFAPAADQRQSTPPLAGKTKVSIGGEDSEKLNAETSPLPVIVFAGQSNMVGKGRVSELPPELSVPQSKAWCWEGKSNSWVPLIPGKSAGGGSSFGPEISFAAAWGKPMGIIKFAVSGTDLADAWDVDRPEGLYDKLRNLVLKAKADSRPIEIVGMIWMQGEKDSKSAEMASAYSKNLQRLIERARKDFQSPNMIFVAGRVNPPRDKYPYAQTVRAAQVSCPLPRYGWINLDDQPQNKGGLHYTSAGLIEMGRRFAAKLSEIAGDNASANVQQITGNDK